MSTATQTPPAQTASAPTSGGVRGSSAATVFGVLVRERLRERRLVPFTWGGALGAMGALMVLVWPAIEDTVGKLVASYPKEFMQAFGITGFNSVEQYVDGELFGLLVPLAAAALAVRCVIRPIAGAEDAGQLDTWLTMPISRRTLAWSSLAAAGLVLAAVMFVMWAITMLTSVVSGGGLSAAALGRGVVNVWPLAMFFAAVALLACGATRGSSRVTGAAIGALVAMYLVDLVGKLDTGLADLRYASAFRYYGSAIENGLDAGHVLGLLVVGLLLAAAGAELLQRRDL